MYTNETTHYGIPLPLGSDLTTPMDYNEAMQKVDRDLYANTQDVAQATGKVNDLEVALGETNDEVTAVKGRVTTLEGTVTTQGNAITQNASRIEEVEDDALDMICAVDEGTAQVASVRVDEGKYFRYNNVLYMADADIEIGDTIVPNTNCHATNVATELENLKGDSSLPTRVTTLEGKVETLEEDTRANNFETNVDLLSYDSFSNLYTIPTDGYLRIDSGTGNGHASINVYGANTTSASDPHISFSAQASTSGNTPVSMFVKKGMKCYRSNNGQTSPEYHYYPLS